MSATAHDEFDLFLSHASPDKMWVRTLEGELRALGLRVFLDESEIAVGDNFVLKLSDSLARSRYMVLVLSSHTEGRPWVKQEWTSFMAGAGPLGRLLPVKIDTVELPAILGATQTMDATDRDASRVAGELFKVVGDPSKLGADDARRLVLGRDLVFTLNREDDHLKVVEPAGSTREVPLPWEVDGSFGVAHLEFGKLHRQEVTTPADRTDLFRHARTLGTALFSTLFDDDDAERLGIMLTPDRARPVVQIRTDDDLLLSLPWELLCHRDEFLVREGRIDLVRTTPSDVAAETLLRKPTGPFKLVVNVSAPEGSHLNYEGESYRITRATAGRCEMVPTELGTLEDLIETVNAQHPTGIHFSGHGMPGALQFENDEGGSDVVQVQDVVGKLRQELPDERRLPHFFFLASCHGNDPVALDDGQAGAPSAAVQLHKAGTTEVVGYFGPIADELSTRAEETIYETIANGGTTRDAVRRARRRLTEPLQDADAWHRLGFARTEAFAAASQPENTDAPLRDTHPFAWAQLVLYRRGPEWPLSIETSPKHRGGGRTLQRRLEGFGSRKVLRTGFIGRRAERHEIRRRIREGARTIVLQGLGGLGKTTLAQEVLPWLTTDPADVCTLWCREVEEADDRAAALVAQLLDYCRMRFGLDWEGVVQQVDRVAGDDPAMRCLYFLKTLAQKTPGLVLYFDNLESLLVGPKDEENSEAFGQWAEPALELIWRTVDEMARETQSLYLIASCRYRNEAFGDSLLTVSPLPDDAMFRLTGWFLALQRLTPMGRARLVSRLEGHPRAVQYANDLVSDALAKWRDRRGKWTTSVPPTPAEVAREWNELVEPCLPKVEDELQDNLLLMELWDHVLDERAQRFLCRMTVLRRPVEWDLLVLLGDPGDPEGVAHDTAERLKGTSLLEQVEMLARVGTDGNRPSTRYTLHPATERFVGDAVGDSTELRLAAHRVLGDHLEAAAPTSRYIDTAIEAGYHLFEAGEFDRAYESLGSASEWLGGQGRVREGLLTLEPFLVEEVRGEMSNANVGRLLATVGNFHSSLGEVEKAIGHYEQALVISREIGDRQGEGASLGNLGVAYADLGEFKKAIEYSERQLAICQEIGDRLGEGVSLGNLGITYANLGEVERAIGYYEKALVISREVGHERGEAGWLGSLGNAYADLGEVEKAIGYYEQQLVISREIGDRQGEARGVGNLGNACADLGEFEKAIGYHEQALVISREIGDRRNEGSNLGSLGNGYLSLGEVEKAIGYYEQRLVISREIGDRRAEGHGLCNLGNSYLKLDEVEKAIGYLERGLVISREIGDRQAEARGLSSLGIASADLGEFEKAIGYHEQALVIFREIGDRRGEGIDLGNLGNTCAGLGEIEKAIGYYERQLVISREIGDRQSEGSVLETLGNAYARLGEPEKASRYLEQALEFMRELGDR